MPASAIGNGNLGKFLNLEVISTLPPISPYTYTPTRALILGAGLKRRVGPAELRGSSMGVARGVGGGVGEGAEGTGKILPRPGL